MRAARLALVLVLLTLGAPAWAQTAPVRLDVVERVDRACPGLIRQDHAFTDAVASLLFAEDPKWGRNGKRGNPNDPSHDAIAYVMPSGPGGVAIIDIIGGAGGPSPSVAWIDQTQATRDAGTTGVWVRPSGVLPACLTGGSTPVPQPSTPPPAVSTPGVDLRPVLDAIARVEARQAALEAFLVSLPPPPEAAALTGYIDAMVGDGPDGDGPLPPHVTDIKERLDVLRVTLSQLAAWLRSRAVLRY